MTSVTNDRYARGQAAGRQVREGVQRVLIVEDSRSMQTLIRQALDADPRLSVVGVANDAYHARDLIKALEPDVLVLDVEMPRMSGLDFLGRLMRLRPMPVVMFSSVTQAGSDAAIRALVLGAVDCLAKPRDGVTGEVLAMLADRVHAAATAPVLLSAPVTDRKRAEPVPPSSLEGSAWSGPVVLIGASTGGVAAMEVVLGGLPPDAPPVVLSQHMPESFLSSFAERLNTILPQRVRPATDGVELKPGHIYLAPGGSEHTGIGLRDEHLVCRAIRGPKRNGHCPSVDELFLSAVPFASRITAVILTGLGRDGADGMLELRKAGAYCIGQDEESSVVFGMPRAAAEAGAVHEQAGLRDIPGAVMRSSARLAKTAGGRR